MSQEGKRQTKVDKYKVFEFISELIGWVKIVMTPLFIGFVIGAAIYFPNPSILRLVLGVIVAVIGLVIGLIWAIKEFKSKGTVWFLSRVMAMPELDEDPDEDKSEE